jgi:hypothetical protein
LLSQIKAFFKHSGVSRRGDLLPSHPSTEFRGGLCALLDIIRNLLAEVLLLQCQSRALKQLGSIDTRLVVKEFQVVKIPNSEEGLILSRGSGFGSLYDTFACARISFP